MQRGETGAATPTQKVFDVGIDERLSFDQLLILGLQNIFGMTGMFVFPGILGRSFNLPPEQIAYLYGMTFLSVALRRFSNRLCCCGFRSSRGRMPAASPACWRSDISAAASAPLMALFSLPP